MFREEQHPATELLLRALDGELSSKEAKAIRRHLQACWKCRAQSDDISRTVNAYTSVFTHGTSSQCLEPPNGWKGFQARLTRLEEQSRRQKRPDVNRSFSALLFGRVALGLPAVLLLLCAVLFWARFTRVQTVSASELLRRATGSEQALLNREHAPGVFQRVSLRWGHQVLTRSTFRDFVHRRRVEKWEQTDSGTVVNAERSRTLNGEVSRCKDAMTKARLNADELLSPEEFNGWLKRQPYAHRESVSRSEHRFRLISEIDAGPVHKAELILRTADYHAVGERFQFADDKELDITELAYEVRPPTLAEEPEKVRVTAAVVGGPRLQTRKQISAELPGEVEQAELQARIILHREGADLGEQVVVERSGNAVAVTGIVESSKRKNELADALKGVAHVQVRLQTVDEAEAQLTSQYNAPTTLLSTPMVEPPLLLDEMKARFSDDQRRSYVSQLLSLSDQALRHAFALRELARRYPAGGIATLPAAFQGELQELAQEHLNAIGEEQAELKRLVSPFLEAGPEGTRELFAGSWQSGADLLAKRLQQEHNVLVSLFAAGDTTGRTADALKQELAESLYPAFQAQAQ